MALRILRFIHHWFALAAFWGYLAAFALAFTMAIVFFPAGALALLLAGLLSLPVVVVISTGMGWWERAWCRRWLRTARCPSCLEAGAVEDIDENTLHATAGAGGADCDGAAMVDEHARFGTLDAPRYECRRCGACFAASGEGVESPLAA